MHLFDSFARYAPGPTAAWFWLCAAGCAEVGWAVALKQSDGFTRTLPTVFMIACLIISFPLLAVALKTLPVSSGYAVWTGIGVAGAAVIGMLYLSEPVSAGKIACIALILAGVAGLKFVTEA